MSKTPNGSHLSRTKWRFFPNCKQILCITIIKLVAYEFFLHASSFHNVVVGSVRFSMFWSNVLAKFSILRNEFYL